MGNVVNKIHLISYHFLIPKIEYTILGLHVSKLHTKIQVVALMLGFWQKFTNFHENIGVWNCFVFKHLGLITMVEF